MAVRKETDRQLKEKSRADRRKRSAWTPVLQGVLFSVLPILLFYIVEAYDRNPFAQIRPYAQGFNILLYELVIWILFLVTGRAAAAILMEGIPVLLLGLVNHYVLTFRSTPFMPWDVFSLGTALTVADNYDFTPTPRVLLVSAALVIVTAAGAWGLRNFRWRKKVWIRCLPAILLAMALVFFGNLLQDSSFQTRYALYPYLFTPSVMTKYNGSAVTLTMEMAYLVVEKPEGYSAEKARETLEDYQAAETNEEEEQDYPNIIVIMDEAFSDLAVLGDLETSEDYMPFVHSLQEGAENTVTGMLHVSVCGGNTADTEYEFLTGDTMAFLPTGSIPYQQYIRKTTSSLASLLAEKGYATYAQHPYYGYGWERERVYPLLGFENLSFISDYSSWTKIRSYCSDASCFEKIIETFDNKEEGQPIFLFNVTMQNHGSYSGSDANFENTITAGLENVSLDQYLSLLSVTDRELEKLVRHFEEEEEKTIIVFFGDHQPNNTVAASVWKANGVDYRDLTEEENALRYQVPYLIWANYDIEEGQGQDTSANYLGGHILDLAGIERNAYYSFLADMEEELPVITAVENPLSDDEISDLLQTYRCLEYYHLFDENEK